MTNLRNDIYKITSLLATRQITATEADNLICEAIKAKVEEMPDAYGTLVPNHYKEIVGDENSHWWIANRVMNNQRRETVKAIKSYLMGELKGD